MPDPGTVRAAEDSDRSSARGRADATPRTAAVSRTRVRDTTVGGRTRPRAADGTQETTAARKTTHQTQTPNPMAGTTYTAPPPPTRPLPARPWRARATHRCSSRL